MAGILGKNRDNKKTIDDYEREKQIILEEVRSAKIEKRELGYKYNNLKEEVNKFIEGLEGIGFLIKGEQILVDEIAATLAKEFVMPVDSKDEREQAHIDMNNYIKIHRLKGVVCKIKK